MQMEECTCPLAPDEAEEDWMAGIIERYGTREDFIANGRLREEQRNELQI